MMGPLCIKPSQIIVKGIHRQQRSITLLNPIHRWSSLLSSFNLLGHKHQHQHQHQHQRQHSRQKVSQQYLSTKTTTSTSTLPPIDDGAGQLSLFSHDDTTTGSSSNNNNTHHYDVGGLESLMGQPVDITDPTLQEWEQEIHALLIKLIQSKLLTTDELRRHIESMQYNHYVYRSYYCKWATSITLSLIERNIISYSEIDSLLLHHGKTDSDDEEHNKDDNTTSTTTKDEVPPKFSIGETVQVRSEQSMGRWRKPHLRTPGYIFGMRGLIESYEGKFADPSYKAFRSILKNHTNKINRNGNIIGKAEEEEEEPKEHLYRVTFSQNDVWPEGKNLKADVVDVEDTVTIEIYENWLLQVDDEDGNDSNQMKENKNSNKNAWEMDPATIIQNTQNSPTNHHHHDHHAFDDHDHDHEHLPRSELEQRAIDLEQSLCTPSGTGSIDKHLTPTNIVGDRLCSVLMSLLEQPLRLGSNLRHDIKQIIDTMESIKIRADGVTLVVRAWMDPEFEHRLLQDAASAALQLGINTVNATAPTKLKVVKSELPTTTKPGVHNIITCTLCSCYPLSLLGLSPKWYKSRSYRARAVREPRAMLRDSFGLDLSTREWNIRVHDSTADLRYLVLPPRPAFTEGWSEEELRKLITRDTMIGVAMPEGIIVNEK